MVTNVCYTYASNNPVRYTDPSGFFEEDQIMQYLGVNTWDEVLTMFEAGRFAGSWGWLEVLREAESGDEVSIWFHSADAYQSDAVGVLRDIEGTLVFQFNGGHEVPGVQLGAIGTDKAWGYSVIYGVDDRVIFNRKHNRVRFSPNEIDPQDMQDELQSAAIPIGEGFMLLGAAHADVPMIAGGTVLVINGVRVDIRSTQRSWQAYGNNELSGRELAADLATIWMGYSPAGVLFDAISIGRTVAPAFSYTP